MTWVVEALIAVSYVYGDVDFVIMHVCFICRVRNDIISGRLVVMYANFRSSSGWYPYV